MAKWGTGAAINGKVVEMPPLHQGYAMAREILRNHDMHGIEAIDAAFEVLVYSQDPFDKALCRAVEEELWKVPRPGAMVIVITMLAVAVTCVGLATLFARMVQ